MGNKIELVILDLFIKILEINDKDLLKDIFININSKSEKEKEEMLIELNNNYNYKVNLSKKLNLDIEIEKNKFFEKIEIENDMQKFNNI